ncbi:MAG: hypothetical protein RMJ87_08550 [Cytophagales bacterium]|nr:hypothetical protein [Cytophagales bacterium]
MKSYLIAILLIGWLAALQQQCKQSAATSTHAPCQTLATFRYNMCGVGLWGGAMVLELENGEIVQPWYTNDEAIRNFTPQKDIKVRVTLTDVPQDDRYAHVVTCMAIGEYQARIRRYVRVDCLQVLP